MQERDYRRILEGIRKRRHGEQIFLLMDRLITGVVFVAYPALLLYLLYTHDSFVIRAFFVPLISFIILSVFRRCFDAPRPYEVYDIRPVIPKETKGKSFPSRHVFSVFMIAMTFLAWDTRTGLELMLIGVVLAILRVAGGVHFIRDVLAGAACGIAAGLVGYFLI